MCGLIAIFDPSGVVRSDAETSLGMLKHRGPDAQGYKLYKNDRLFLGHARLKIIDRSQTANQPYISPCGEYTIIYNGEIYNYQEIRDEIGLRWNWSTRSDTEVLLAAWCLWGADCLKKLVGMFAFAVYDNTAGKVYLARDRFGIKPFYFSRNIESGQWIAASEIPPILYTRRSASENLSTIRDYLEYGLYDHTHHTFFRHIYSVGAGGLIEIDLSTGTWADSKWYRVTENIPDLSKATDEEIYQTASTLIEQAVKSNLIADVDVGLNVSGGVDSSMLVRMAVEQLGAAHLFTQDYEGYSELPWVNEISQGGDLHVASLTSEMIYTSILKTTRDQAEPFGGVSVCGYNFTYELARKNNVTVLLDGNGVDETFLGYKRYHQQYIQSSSTDSEYRSREQEYFLFWGEKYKAAAVGEAIDGSRGVRPEAISPSLLHEPGLSSCVPTYFGDPVKQAAAVDLLHNKIPRGLRFNDRVSMAHSRELRVPFLDHRLVEFAFAIPTEKLIGGKGTKRIFRDILAKRGGAEVAYCPKRSVQSPQREWIAKDWRPWIENILVSESFRSRNWVCPDKAGQLYNAYLNGDQDNSFYIWQWLNLELWAREYLD
ncbi:asparagine synthase (glutamine-hydrolyzing) [Hahella sp. KA22]|uniref:asparagine synthase (glutamine-hydrolyzing) n=1 Tax=Hahella sp. KA22 TaxID=1628392 RepID=UPI000FDD58D4|nr:asparagine synthase (glutamine-hydrolyzing) [Hahella sp. KA22]AZZ91670.1 asparagine synthase (glutamine-hydrolyzing) [Hahella sp. KA22]QAY55040.1 asparagine synthase (glutamine-hydrolyzing) [Hahella sp. KA22]